MLTQFFVSGTKVSRTKVVNPNRGVRENQFVPGLRRGIFFNFGIVPSRDANRRALSRSMRALSASRINAVFSATPVNSWAMRTRSSSSATVVLMAPIIASTDVIYRALQFALPARSRAGEELASGAKARQVLKDFAARLNRLRKKALRRLKPLVWRVLTPWLKPCPFTTVREPT